MHWMSQAHPPYPLDGFCLQWRSSVTYWTTAPVRYYPSTTLVLLWCRADIGQDHSRALRACIRGPPKDWRRRTGRPRQTWLRTVGDDFERSWDVETERGEQVTVLVSVFDQQLYTFTTWALSFMKMSDIDYENKKLSCCCDGRSYYCGIRRTV